MGYVDRERIGVRALQQHASALLRRVRGGDSFEGTERGHSVAILTPPQHGLLDSFVPRAVPFLRSVTTCANTPSSCVPARRDHGRHPWPPYLQTMVDRCRGSIGKPFGCMPSIRTCIQGA